MNRFQVMAVCGLGLMAFGAGCTAPQVDFNTIQRPGRAPELDAYNVFVGEWTWEADVVNTTGADKHWKGTAKWMWTLDKRCLHGTLSAKSTNRSVESAGVWSWHPLAQKYTWWMLNDWGYPQDGTAKYDAATKTWTMTYTGVGLDRTTTHGVCTIRVVSDKVLDWSLKNTPNGTSSAPRPSWR